MITVHTSEKFKTEKEYVINFILSELLGITHEIVYEDRMDYCISAGNKRIILPDRLFNVFESEWLKQCSLPERPLLKWKLPDYLSSGLYFKDVTVIYGDPESTIGSKTDDYIPIDIFGSAFFMLTRYEEAVQRDLRDMYGRFPAHSSLAFNEGFLDSPIVNQYVEILWAQIRMLVPGIERKNRTFRIVPSHDIDHPFMLAGISPLRFLKYAIGTTYRNGAGAAFRLYRSWRCYRSNFELDPFFTFKTIMDISESNNLTSCFFFIVDKCRKPVEIFTDLRNTMLHPMLREISGRGHEIGLHTTFESYDNPGQISKEFNSIRKICEDNGVCQGKWGARQHFLNIRFPKTLTCYDNAGIDYDSSVMFPEHIGFRSGICCEYPVFDIFERKQLHINERPLLVMDGTIMDNKYMGIGCSAGAFDLITDIKRKCAAHNGDFTLLWHNNTFQDQESAEFYQSILSQKL